MTDSQIRANSARPGRFVIWLLCGLFFLCTSQHPALAQALSITQFNHKAWTVRDGAPAGVLAMAQAHDGWLWLGTPTGLYRFDGIQFEQIGLDGLDPRRSKAISVLYAPSADRLWIGYVQGGVSLLEHGQFTHFGDAEEMGRNTVLWMADDTRGGTWMACANALWRYDGQKWSRVGSDWGFPERYATALHVDQRGTLWVAGEHEIFFLEQQSLRFEATGMKVEGAYGGDFIASPDGRTWYANESGIHPLPAQAAGSPRAPGSNARTSFATLIDRGGSIWRLGESKIRRLPFDASRTELLFKDYPNPETFGAKDGLSDATTRTILEDAEGNIWVGTAGGIDRFRPTNVHGLPPPVNELGGRAMARAENGGLWIGSTFGLIGSSLDGLWKFDGQPRRIAVPGITGVTAVDVDAGGKLWIAGPEGVWRQEGQEEFRKMAEPPEGTRGQDVHAIIVDVEGNPWISVVRSNLFRYRQGAWERNGGLSTLPPKRPNTLVRDREGRLWFGYGDGKLAVVESEQVRLLGAAEGLDIGGIDALHVGLHTVVASESRVAVLDSGQFHLVTTPSDPATLEGITGILESKNGDLWLSGFKGAVRVAASDLDRAIQSRTYELPSELFDAEDGFPGMAQRVRPLPTIVEGSDGRIWFAGTQNIASLDPATIRRNAELLPVAIRSLTADGHEYSPRGPLSLLAGTRDLQVDYTALNLSRPDRVRFRYRLDGFDEGWIDAASRRQAFYTNLGPGRYRFRVAAAIGSGGWNESASPVEITIPPTFVQTRIFLALCVAAGILALWLAYSLRIRLLTARMRNRLEERVAERERIARELHDTLLQGVQGVILKFQDATEEIPRESPARQMMEEALDRADEVLIEGRDRVKDLRAQASGAPGLAPALGAIGVELAKGQSTRFDLVVEGAPRLLYPIVEEEAIRIGNEALANAFHHALASRIEVEIIYLRAGLRLRIRDDGCGIDAAILETGRPDHWGLHGMRERAKKIRAKLDIWSRRDAGTEIELKVPARIAYQKNTRWWNSWFAGGVRKESPQDV